MLTTLTTVLGLSPLLYETSSQAQFLKPTVITLVYGLGFGVVLVLVIVPALIAMQADVGAQVVGFKRAFRGLVRKRGPRLPFATALIGVTALFIVTLGWVSVSGTLPALFLMLPLAGILSALQMAFILFLSGGALFLLAIYILSGLAIVLQFKR